MHTQRNRLMGTLLKKNARYFIIAFALTAFTSLMQFITPALLAELMDHYLGSEPSRLPAFINDGISRIFGADFLSRNLWVFGLTLILVNLISGVFSFFRGKLTAQGSESTARYLRDELYDHMQ